MESTKFSLLVNRGDELKTNADLRAEHRAFFAANLERRMRELKMSQADLARAVWQETRLTKAEIGSLTQDCVSVNYSYVGVRDGLIYTGEGLWTLEVPDHALGRAVKRSRLFDSRDDHQGSPPERAWARRSKARAGTDTSRPAPGASPSS